MNGSSLSEQARPAYPALAACLVVESRTSYRSELRNKLNATQLFEQLVEPINLEEGLQSLRTRSFDACIIGASVTPRSTAWFLGAASTSRAPECAFLRIRRADRPPLSELHVAAHGELDWPCTRQALFDSMVAAVLSANSSSPWGKIARDAERPVVEVRIGRGIASMLSDTDSLLSEIASGLQSGRYRLDNRGEPTEMTRAALTRVVDSILGSPGTAPEDESDTSWLHALLVAEFSVWVVEYLRDGQLRATKNLRKRLIERLSALTH